MTAADQPRHGELHSFMNDSRWRKLRAAIEDELPFVPASQVQKLNDPPVRLADPTGCGTGPTWDHENVQPYQLIEWMRLIPRRYDLNIGFGSARIVEDYTSGLRDILVRLKAPFHEDQHATFWVYGYAPSDPATFSTPWRRLDQPDET